MSIRRREFMQMASVTAGATLLGAAACNPTDQAIAKPISWQSELKSMTADDIPITVEERKSRIARAQELMIANKIQAIVIDSGTALNYFTGIRWWPSERTAVAIIPAQGEIAYVCPAFEESRFRELISVGNQVVVWQEDESPYQKIADVLRTRNYTSGTIGMEERLRFFIYDGIRKAAPQFNYVSADPVTMNCRMIKSAAELALMQKASDITVAAIKAGISQLKEGMSQGDLNNIISEAHTLLGAPGGGGLILFAESSAYPHGSTKPRTLKKGDIVLMDCGCSIQGYSSDITRTVVFGAPPTKRQQEIWDLEKKSQDAGFAAAVLGKPCEDIDHAARKVITDAGFGPGYKLPGLPHRTGHGIGMDGHEWGNAVNGNKQLLHAGMCFSIEPTIAIPGEFGVRLEDCVYMTEQGPKWFSPVATAIDKPFG